MLPTQNGASLSLAGSPRLLPTQGQPSGAKPLHHLSSSHPTQGSDTLTHACRHHHSLASQGFALIATQHRKGAIRETLGTSLPSGPLRPLASAQLPSLKVLAASPSPGNLACPERHSHLSHCRSSHPKSVLLDESVLESGPGPQQSLQKSLPLKAKVKSCRQGDTRTKCSNSLCDFDKSDVTPL